MHPRFTSRKYRAAFWIALRQIPFISDKAVAYVDKTQTNWFVKQGW